MRKQPSRTSSSTESLPHMAVLVPFRSQWGRGVARGIGDYAMTHCRWLLTPYDIQSLWRSGRQRRDLALPSFDAVFTALRPDIALHVDHPDPAILAVSARTPAPVRVVPDERAAGRAAADYFLELGLRNFVCFTFEDSERIDSFRDVIEQRGGTCLRHDVDPHWVSTMLDFEGGRLDNLAEWLATLPRPVGVFCLNDRAGILLIQAARTAGLHVPEDVAVLGCDDDDLLCHQSRPSLSSVNLDYERVGRDAAAVMDQWLRTGTPPEKESLIPPMGVIQRGSTDVQAHGDADVARAVRFIRDHAHEPIQVDDVVEHTLVSRRSLEKRFNDVVGESIATMIRRKRTTHAYHLLRETNLSVTRVALSSGFAGVSQLSRAMKQQYHVPPTQLRNGPPPKDT